MRLRTVALAPLFALIVAGCGGGSGSGSSAVDSGTLFQFADLVGRAAATNPPVSTNSTNILATGFTGAITSLRVRDQAVSWEDCRIVFSSNRDGDFDIYSMDVDGTDIQKLTNNTTHEYVTDVSGDGKRVAYNAVINGNFEVCTMNIDGSGQTNRTNNPAGDRDASFSPDGSELVFSSNRDNGASSDLYRVNLSTNAVTRVTNTAFAEVDPVYSPDGSWIFFISSKDQATTGSNIYRSRVDGTAYQHFFGTSGNDSEPIVASDGMVYFVNGDVELMRVSFDGFFEALSNTPNVESQVNVSPDAKKLIFSSTSGPMRSLLIGNTTPNASYTKILNGSLNGAVFAPPIKDRVLVGSGGALGPTAAGIIVSQRGDQMKSVLSFGAVTQSTVVLTQQTGANSTSPNLSYMLDADTVSYISYINGISAKATKVVGSGLGVTQCDGAFVSIDADTGYVVAVIPFDGARGAKRAVREEGGDRVYTGSFSGVFDATGQNLAPQGATEVRIELSTGRISVH